MVPRLILVALAVAGLGGCAVYPATPYYGGYYSAPSVYVAPAPRPYYGPRYGYYGPGWGHRGWRRW